METGNQDVTKPTETPVLVGQSDFNRTELFVPSKRRLLPKASTIFLWLFIIAILALAGYLSCRFYRDGADFLAKIFHSGEAKLIENSKKNEILACRRSYDSSELIAAGNARTGETTIKIEYANQKPLSISREIKLFYSDSSAARSGLNHLTEKYRLNIEELTKNHQNPLIITADYKNTHFIITHSLSASKLSTPLHTLFDLPDPKNLDATQLRRHYASLQHKYSCHKTKRTE